ncbi:MAG: T9SS type A sorting domain-containing protein, partial [Bacteroidales bacterium]|nr:T9SS type A sorting domain-containing protein [Bacteroidales bacterium]
STQLTVELTGLPPWEIIIGSNTFNIEQTPWFYWVKPEITTEFTISSVTHANGCTNSGSGNALVTVYELPQPNLGPDTNICINHVITLFPGSFVSYEWFDGSTEPEFVFNAASYGIGITDVSVIVTDENGCKAESAVSVNVEECAGIEELDNLNIGIYPNPNNGTFTLKLNSSEINKINYRIVNSIGNVLFKVKDVQINGEYENTIDLSDYSEGIYFLIIENKKGIINKKIVIQ